MRSIEWVPANDRQALTPIITCNICGDRAKASVVVNQDDANHLRCDQCGTEAHGREQVSQHFTSQT